MTKKQSAKFLILSGICAFGSFAAAMNPTAVQADSAVAESIVSVNVFNQTYYGTLTQDAAVPTSVFTSLKEPAFQIEGIWNADSFKGDCTITSQDGSICSVKYKKGNISGTVKVLYPDGSYTTFNTTSGTPYRQQSTYDKKNSLLSVDCYYLGTLQSTWKENALSPSYSELTDTPYEYVDLPVNISGTVQAIYEGTRYSYLKIIDDQKHIYLFKNINLRIDKYAPARIKNLSVGDRVTICGKYQGLTNPEKHSLNLFEHALGYELSFKEFQNSIVTSSFLNNYRPMGILTDKELENPVPELIVITCESDTETADPLHLTGEYKEICAYPFYYMEQSIELCGTVCYENYEPSSKQAVLLVQKEQSDDIYAITWKTTKYSSLQNQKIRCSGYLNGNNKIPYLNAETKAIGYALYPNITAERVSEQE